MPSNKQLSETTNTDTTNNYKSNNYIISSNGIVARENRAKLRNMRRGRRKYPMESCSQVLCLSWGDDGVENDGNGGGGS